MLIWNTFWSLLDFGISTLTLPVMHSTSHVKYVSTSMLCLLLQNLFLSIIICLLLNLFLTSRQSTKFVTAFSSFHSVFKRLASPGWPQICCVSWAWTLDLPAFTCSATGVHYTGFHGDIFMYTLWFVLICILALISAGPPTLPNSGPFGFHGTYITLPFFLPLIPLT